MIVVAARPLVVVLVTVTVVVVLQSTATGYEIGLLLALTAAAAAFGKPGGTEVVSDRIGVKPLGIGMVVVPEDAVIVT